MSSILMVLTSHSRLGNSGRATGVWLEEFATPYYVLIDAGHSVELASPQGGAIPIDPASREASAQTDATRRLEADGLRTGLLSRSRALSELDAGRFDAVFYPGGHGPMWDLAVDPVNAGLLKAFWQAGKPVAAVCHGVAALLAARSDAGDALFSGRRLTAFTDAEERRVGLDEVVPFLLQDKLVLAGAIFEEAPPFSPHTVVDGQLVTGQNPASAQGAAQALVELLKQ